MKKFSASFRVLALLLVVCLCSVYVPVVTFAADVTPGTITITTEDGSTVELNAELTEATIGDGSAAYDVDNNKVTLTNVVAQKVVFAMNGEFTVESVGVNAFDSTALEDPTGALTVSSGNVTIIGEGKLNLTSTQSAILASGRNVTVENTDLYVEATSTFATTANNITVSGATVEVRSNSSAALTASKGIVIQNQSVVNTYSVAGRAINGQTVTIDNSTVKTYVVVDDETTLVSKYGITATSGDLCIQNNAQIDAQITTNSALYTASETTTVGIKILNSTVVAGGPGNLLRSAGMISVKDSHVTSTAATSTLAFNAASSIVIDNSTIIATATATTMVCSAGPVSILNGSHVEATARTGQKAIGAQTLLTLDNSYVKSISTGNTFRSESNMVISGDAYDEETGKGTYLYTSGDAYGLWTSGLMTINGGTIIVDSNSDTSFGAVGSGGGYEQNGGDLTVNVKTAAKAFDIRNAKNMTLNGGSITANWTTEDTTSAIVRFRAASSQLILNGGKLFSDTADSLVALDTETNAASITVSPYVDVDLTLGSAAYTGTAITVSDEGVIYEEGKELTAAATSVKTVPTKIADATIVATVTVNGAAQEGKTVVLLKDGVEVDSALSDANGNVVLTIPQVEINGTYTYTIKQVAEDANGYYHDLEEREISVYVEDDATGTITGDASFENVYKYITVTTESETITFGDTEGDNTATPILDGAVSYDADTATVVINNLTATSIVFDLKQDFTLKIEGENTVDIGNSASSAVLVLTGVVTITGDGVLTANAKSTTIYGHQSVIVNGATLNLTASGGATILHTLDSLTVNGGKIIGTATTYYGIYATNDVTITGGEIDIDAAANVIGAVNGSIIISGGKVTVETVTTDKYGDYALRATNGSITISGDADVSAKAVHTVLGVKKLLTITPGVKLYAENLNGNADKMTSAPTISVDGVRFVTGRGFGEGSAIVETLLDGEKDYNLPGEGTITVNVTLNGEPDNGRGVQLLKDGDVIDSAYVGEGKVFFKVNPVGEGEHTYTVQVVGENGNGYTFDKAKEIIVTVDSNGFATADEVTFENTYVAPTVDVNLSASVVGKDADVQLILDGEVVETVTPVEGVATFTTLTLENGTYIYTIKQNAENGAGWTYDDTEYTITVTVADGVATVEGEAIFTNTYKAAPADVTFEVYVTLDGRDMVDDEFLLIIGEDEVSVIEGKVSWTSTYELEGTYTITVMQKDTALVGVTYDLEPKTITVTVTDNAGQLVAFVEGNNATFANTYVAPTADVTLSATVNGKDADVQLILDGEVIETVTSVEGVANFATLTLENGTYTYTIKQNAENAAGWTYDASEKTITVTVENGVASIEGEAVFTNTYKAAPTTADADLLVSLFGATLEEGAFTFELLKDGEVVATVTNDAEGNVCFKDIEITEAGEIVYVARQVIGDVASMTYDANEIVLTFYVEDWGEGYLDVCGMDCKTRTFTNVYKVPFVAGEIVDGKYVDENGKGVEQGLVKIGEDYYYVGPNGVVVTGQKYYAWRLNVNCEYNFGWYTFAEDGRMITDGIFDGVYYVNGVGTEVGLTQIDGDYYYVGPNGVLVVDERYYAWNVSEGFDLPADWYWFDAEGKMIGASAEGEIVTIEGVKYYYRSGKPTEMGLFEYEGDYYVAQYDGMIITSESYTRYGAGKYYVWKANGEELTKGYWRYFDAEGKMIGASSEGEIVTINGVQYYFVNGAAKEMGLFEYEGNYYVAQYDGKIITNKKYYVWKINDSANEISKGWYTFGADGAMITE